MYPFGSRHSPPRISTRLRLDSKPIKACTRFKELLKWAVLSLRLHNRCECRCQLPSDHYHCYRRVGPRRPGLSGAYFWWISSHTAGSQLVLWSTVRPPGGWVKPSGQLSCRTGSHRHTQKLFVQLLIRRRLLPACGSPAKESTNFLTKTLGRYISIKTNLINTATGVEMS